MKRFLKKGFLSIEVIIIGALVLLFGVLVVKGFNRDTDWLLSQYEGKMQNETTTR